MKADLETWIAFARKINDTAYGIIETSKLEVTAKGAADAKIIACALLARSASNLKVVLTLVEDGQAVEARTIARCILENQFWVAELVNKGDAFVQDMLGHEIAGKQARGEFLFSRDTTRNALSEETQERLRKHLKDVEKAHSKPAMLNPKSVAAKTPVYDLYILYSQLSSDAAHPTIDSLGRHVPSPYDFDAAPLPRPGELVATLVYTCLAMLGACVGTNQLLDGTPAGTVLELLMQEYRSLEDGTAVAA